MLLWLALLSGTALVVPTSTNRAVPDRSTNHTDHIVVSSYNYTCAALRDLGVIMHSEQDGDCVARENIAKALLGKIPAIMENLSPYLYYNQRDALCYGEWYRLVVTGTLFATPTDSFP